MEASHRKFIKQEDSVKKGEYLPGDQEEFIRKRTKAIPGDAWPYFFRSLAMCLQAGIHIERAFELIADDEGGVNDVLSLRAMQIARSLNQGESFRDSLRHLQSLKPFHVEMLVIGQKSGQLPGVLDRLADYEEESYATELHVRSSLTYPLIMVLFILILTVGIPIYFKDSIMAGLEFFLQTSPFFMKVVFAVAYFFHYKFLFAAALFFLFTWKPVWKPVVDLFSSEENRVARRKWWYLIPYVRRISQGLACERFAMALAMQLNVGCHILPSVKLAFRATTDPVFTEAASQVDEQLRAGRELHEALALVELFPNFFISMVKVGEETAELPKMLSRTYRILKDERELVIKTALDLLQPLVLLFLGCVVAFVAALLLLPMTQLIRTL
ncbi:MAG: type II secretion system F family protein [Candidatus Eremiobacteraeota bacterium]|nr:type II secretion system F family protein [Candidatus Eremiobacteraeota bacterium]